MALFKLLLTGFECPANLAARNSNFRFVFQLRHFDTTNETWVTTESVSPGLSTFWECDASREHSGGNDAKYVRDGANPRFRTLSPWDQVVLLVNSSELFQMRAVAYDVNRADWVDHLRTMGEGLMNAFVAAAKDLPGSSQLAAPVGTLLETLRVALVERLAKEDTVLFAVTYEFGTNQSSQDIQLRHGGYNMRLSLETSGQAAPRSRAAATAAGGELTTGRIDGSTAFAQIPATPTTRMGSGKKAPARARRSATNRPRKTR